MCGIAGIFVAPEADAPSLESLARMTAMLLHRGPDGHGLYRDDRVGLAHTRLSIIDLAGGAQPMSNEVGSIWVTFNGEIFNYVELRQELAKRGHRFQTRSDTEVIVHAFEEYGEQAWCKFNGQFAFALWDRPERRLWLVRDRVGILPLFYARLGDRVLFASEMKALFAAGQLEPSFDQVGLTHVFTRWSATPPRTVFSGVQTVVPGTSLCFDSQLTSRRRSYWELDLSEDAGAGRLTMEDAADELAARLDRAVQLRLRADVPVGAYVSGGLDSSIIAQRIRHAESSALETFSVRFADPQFDETPQQRTMVRLLGSRHHDVLCDSPEIRTALPDVVWHCESPLVRTAPAPLFLLSGLVREYGMKVVLTGEGADEILAGYDIFKEDRLRRFWARQPTSRRRPALFSRLYGDVGAATQRTPWWQEFFARGLLETDDPYYSHRVRWENTSWGLRVLSPDFRTGNGSGDGTADLDEGLPSAWGSWLPLARAQTLEMTTFLSSYLLCSQGDRVAMAHGVEVRYPFLDPDVFTFCARLPAPLKLCGLRDKVVLRALARRHLPMEIADRPKRPYRAPMTRPLFGDSSPDYVDDLLSPAGLRRHGLVNPSAATRLVDKARARAGVMSGEREEMALVGLLTLQLLAQQFTTEFEGRVQAACARLRCTPPTVNVNRLAGEPAWQAN